MSALCRDCLTAFEAPPGGLMRCPACASPRCVAHEELMSLSIAHMD
ncbi:MAG: DNA polymerase IV, partial [Rhodobacteraceae bacterium]|nr:DNA polymerase IV [Paracoccaceae bacterium]